MRNGANINEIDVSDISFGETNGRNYVRERKRRAKKERMNLIRVAIILKI